VVTPTPELGNAEEDVLLNLSHPLFTPRVSPLIESVIRRPTPTPAPTPTPKWVPQNIATDGERILEGLVAEDSVNIMIMGVDRTAHLMDTLGVVSVSRSEKSVKLIMFPRDLYIGYSDEVVGLLKKMGHSKLPGMYKINNVYNIAKNSEKLSDTIYNKNKFEVRGFDFLSQVIYEKFDIIIDDFVQVNTWGFVKMVDAFGGVTVYVPTYMRYNDPTQGLNINLSKGSKHLNGTQAEGFVRFREGYNSSGELVVFSDRTKNQIAFIKAFYEQHAKLSNITKIPEVIDILKKNIVHSVDADELFTKYVDLLTLVVNETYTFDSVSFKTDDRRINGSLYLEIESVDTGSSV
jgi:LCP family protein required for cell wall assembly